MTSEIPRNIATTDEPTDPREPTRYPSEFDFLTSRSEIRKLAENSNLIIGTSSFSSRSTMICGSSSP